MPRTAGVISDRLRPSRRGLLSLGLLGLLPGCGFRPLYAAGESGTMSVAQAELAAITVGIIPDRTGQLLRQALQDRFERQGIGVAHRFELAVAFAIGEEGVGTLPDSANTRSRVIGTASWTLRNQDPLRTTLDSGVARSVDGYDVIDQQPFAADMEREATQRRIAENVADQITLQLALYFKRHPAIG